MGDRGMVEKEIRKDDHIGLGFLYWRLSLRKKEARGGNAQERHWSDLIPVRQTKPGCQLKGTKAVGGRIWRKERGERQLAHTRGSASARVTGLGFWHWNGDTSQPTKAGVQRMAWRTSNAGPDYTGVVVFCVSYNNGEGVGHSLAVQTGWCGCVSALAATCAAFLAVAQQPDAAPPAPAEPIESRRVKGERCCSQARLVEEETKTGITWDRGRPHTVRGWVDVGSLSWRAQGVPCLGPAHGLLE